VSHRRPWTIRRRLPVSLLSLSLGRPRLVLIVWAGLLLLSGLGIARLSIDTSTDSLLERKGSNWTQYEESREQFGDDEVLVVALAAAEPLAPERLDALGELTSTLEAIEGVRRVDSLFSVPLVRSRADGSLSLDPALGRDASLSASMLERLRKDLEGDRIAPGSFLSADRRTFSANVRLEPRLGGRYDSVVSQVQVIAREYGAWVSGVPIFRTELSRAIANELALFIILTTVVVGTLLAVVFRSWVGVLLPLAVGGVGTALTLGAMGASGRPVELSTMVLPSVMLALGCAYSMHVLTFAARVEPGKDLKRALEPVMLPVALSGLTTTIGFLGVTAVEIEGVQNIGAFGALGVLAITSAALTALPATLRLFGLKGAGPPRLHHWIVSLARPWLLAAASQHGIAISVFTLVSIVSVVGIFRLELETDTTRWFPRGHPIRESYEEIRERLSGISPMNIVVISEQGRKVTSPDVLSAIDHFSRYLADNPAVGKVLSLADPLRQVHGGFSGDPKQPLPPSLAAAEQYLLLLESVEQLGDMVSLDHKRANVLLRVDDNGSASLLALAREAEAWWALHGPGDFSAHATGIMYEFARAEDAISRGQIEGLLFAIGIIAVLLFVIFRSMSITVIAVVANLLPVLVGFGVMGILGIPLDAGTAVMGSLALGIAVDDTIHVLVAYDRHRSDSSSGPNAIKAALGEVLPPLLYTTVIVGAGFAVLGFSSLVFTRNLGFLVSGVLGICLVADVVLLPALLMRRDRGGSSIR